MKTKSLLSAVTALGLLSAAACTKRSPSDMNSERDSTPSSASPVESYPSPQPTEPTNPNPDTPTTDQGLQPGANDIPMGSGGNMPPETTTPSDPMLAPDGTPVPQPADPGATPESPMSQPSSPAPQP